MKKQQKQVGANIMAKNGTLDKGGLRRCGLLFSVVMALASWTFLWQDRSGGFIFAMGAFLLLTLTLFKPQLLKGPYLLWARIEGVLGQSVIKIGLTLFFVAVLLPVGLLVKLLKRDLLAVKMPRDGWSYWDRGPDSYWTPKKKACAGVERYEKQY